MSHRKSRHSKGFTLIELCITIAIMGLLLALTATLVSTGMRSWLNGILQIGAQQDARLARNYLFKNLENASAASVLVSRTTTSQPAYSMVTFADVYGNTQQVYQQGSSLVLAIWKPMPTAVITSLPPDASFVPSNKMILIKDGVASFRAYYPNIKDYSNLDVSLCLVRAPRFASKAVQVLMNESVQFKNP